MVAFQCRSVWKCICLRRGLLSLVAVRFLMSSKVILSPCLVDVVRKIGLSVLGRLLSITISSGEIGINRGRLPFSGWLMATVLFCVSMSLCVTATASPIRAAVSFRNCSSVARVGFDAAMSWSISVSVGMK